MLKHVSFVTADAGAVAAFYTALGATVAKDLATPEGWRRLVLDFGEGGRLQFFERPGASLPARPALSDTALGDTAWMEHVALHLPDLGAAVKRLRAEGVRFTREPGLSPSGTPMAFVLDPDGRQVELLQGE